MIESTGAAADLCAEHEELLEFVYLCPYALVKMDLHGGIEMMNSMGAQLFLQIAPGSQLVNLLDVLHPVAPGLRQRIAAYPSPRGLICEALRIDAGLRPGRPLPLVLSVSLLKLNQDRIMAVVADISRPDAEAQARDAELQRSCAAISAASSEKSLLLRSISDGLVTLDRGGLMSGELSTALSTWLGDVPADRPFWDTLAAADPEVGALFRLGWDMLQANQLPVELSLYQMPRRAHLAGRTVRIEYRPIYVDGEAGDRPPDRLLLILSDITSEIERERLEEELGELVAAIDKLIRNRAAFWDFFADAGAQVGWLAGDGGGCRADTLRALHTLKGNAGLFGLARLCHDIESRMADSAGSVLQQAERDALARCWRDLHERLGQLLGPAQDERIGLSALDYEALLEAIRSGQPQKELLRLVGGWRMQRMQDKLDHLAAQVRDLTARLGKDPVRVVAEAGDLRVPAGPWAAFFSALVHVVRNAVDHGLEDPSERRAAGKQMATVWLRATVRGGELVVEIADDGRGVHWELLAARARERGLPAGSRAELIEVLCSDGVSTRQEVSEISGRGVGMGAVRAACAALRGRIEVHSEAGQGTSFRFCFPPGYG